MSLSLNMGGQYSRDTSNENKIILTTQTNE